MSARLVKSGRTIATGPQHMLQPLVETIPGSHVERLYVVTTTRVFINQVITWEIARTYDVDHAIRTMQAHAPITTNAAIGFHPVQ